MRASLAVCLIVPTILHAESASNALIKVEAPWLRATPKGAPVIGGYATIINKGTSPDHLLSASIPVAAKAEVHSMTMNDGIMHMERLKNGLAIAPGASVTLAPSGNHLMFTRPTEQLKQGQTISGTMLFEKAGAIPVTFAVGGIGATAAPGTSAVHGAISS